MQVAHEIPKEGTKPSNLQVAQEKAEELIRMEEIVRAAGRDTRSQPV